MNYRPRDFFDNLDKYSEEDAIEMRAPPGGKISKGGAREGLDAEAGEDEEEDDDAYEPDLSGPRYSYCSIRVSSQTVMCVVPHAQENA